MEKKARIVAIVFILFTLSLVVKSSFVKLAEAVTGWQQVDVNADGKVNFQDMQIALNVFGCPNLQGCSNPPGTSPTPTPRPTSPPGQWAPCAEISFGTQLISDAANKFVVDMAQQSSNKGYIFVGSPYNAIDIDPNPSVNYGYANLSGWQRGFIEGRLAPLANKVASANTAGLASHYEYLAYGPESAHGAGEEALWPDVNVPTAESYAAAGGKLLMYAPSRQDYEENIEKLRPGVNIQYLIADVARHVDIWGFQLGFLQGYVDNGDIGEQEFQNYLSDWVNWIKAGDPSHGHPGNANTKVVVQLGIARYDSASGTCLPPESTNYILNWRERLAYLADGIVVMPSQQCQPCPANPPPGFICTTNPTFIANYQKSFDNALQAAKIVCPK